jgi:hypothetical protein
VNEVRNSRISTSKNCTLIFKNPSKIACQAPKDHFPHQNPRTKSDKTRANPAFSHCPATGKINPETVKVYPLQLDKLLIGAFPKDSFNCSFAQAKSLRWTILRVTHLE